MIENEEMKTTEDITDIENTSANEVNASEEDRAVVTPARNYAEQKRLENNKYENE